MPFTKQRHTIQTPTHCNPCHAIHKQWHANQTSTHGNLCHAIRKAASCRCRQLLLFHVELTHELFCKCGISPAGEDLNLLWWLLVLLKQQPAAADIWHVSITAGFSWGVDTHCFCHCWFFTWKWICICLTTACIVETDIVASGIWHISITAGLLCGVDTYTVYVSAGFSPEGELSPAYIPVTDATDSNHLFTMRQIACLLSSSCSTTSFLIGCQLFLSNTRYTLVFVMWLGALCLLSPNGGMFI